VENEAGCNFQGKIYVKCAVTRGEASQVQILFIFSPRKSKVELQYFAARHFRKFTKLYLNISDLKVENTYCSKVPRFKTKNSSGQFGVNILQILNTKRSS
jgi:hypothetical protein